MAPEDVLVIPLVAMGSSFLRFLLCVKFCSFNLIAGSKEVLNEDSEKISKGYFCGHCQTHLNITGIELLRHVRKHE